MVVFNSKWKKFNYKIMKNENNAIKCIGLLGRFNIILNSTMISVGILLSL